MEDRRRRRRNWCRPATTATVPNAAISASSNGSPSLARATGRDRCHCSRAERPLGRDGRRADLPRRRVQRARRARCEPADSLNEREGQPPVGTEPDRVAGRPVGAHGPRRRDVAQCTAGRGASSARFADDEEHVVERCRSTRPAARMHGEGRREFHHFAAQLWAALGPADDEGLCLLLRSGRARQRRRAGHDGDNSDERRANSHSVAADDTSRGKARDTVALELGFPEAWCLRRLRRSGAPMPGRS